MPHVDSWRLSSRRTFGAAVACWPPPGALAWGADACGAQLARITPPAISKARNRPEGLTFPTRANHDRMIFFCLLQIPFVDVERPVLDDRCKGDRSREAIGKRSRVPRVVPGYPENLIRH